MKLNDELIEFYNQNRVRIQNRLSEFKQIPKEKYFYELCFCLCTPQSKAANALIVQNTLESLNFQQNEINTDTIAEILRKKENYIRFHNQKSKRIVNLKTYFYKIEEVLKSSNDNYLKRDKIQELVNGFGYKEAGHFMRNIGYENLAILDRHILKNLKNAGAFDNFSANSTNAIPKISSKSQYHSVEKIFLEFADKVGISIDELDLLFWAYENGDIIK